MKTNKFRALIRIRSNTSGPIQKALLIQQMAKVLTEALYQDPDMYTTTTMKDSDEIEVSMEVVILAPDQIKAMVQLVAGLTNTVLERNDTMGSVTRSRLITRLIKLTEILKKLV